MKQCLRDKIYTSIGKIQAFTGSIRVHDKAPVNKIFPVESIFIISKFIQNMIEKTRAVQYGQDSVGANTNCFDREW